MKSKGLELLLFLLFAASVAANSVSNEQLHSKQKWTVREDTAEFEGPIYWSTQAQTTIFDRLNLPKIETAAKNLILMIGDGMGLSTITASRIFKGQKESALYGEEARLFMDTFPYIGTSKTYCSDAQVADSACSATAYNCGTKGNYKTIGVTSNVLYKNCTASMIPENQVMSILAWAQSQGMSTGVVSTAPITDASPAGTYAHVANRDWHNDADVEADGYDPQICIDIAQQLITSSPGKNINVILGGGRQHFITNDTLDEESSQYGKRKDGRNLIQEWQENKTNFRYVTTRDELGDVPFSTTDYLLGLFSYADLEFVDKQEEANDPSLVEMTYAAINVLKRNSRGFFLFVEGARIDDAHHSNNAQRALAETLEFDKAIQEADTSTRNEPTLIVVSSDHSHHMTIAGNSLRGNNILGLNENDDNSDGLPATTLSYANGPGYRPPEGSDCSRPDMTNDNVTDIEYQQMSWYHRSSATHSGEDVLIFAKGPFAHLFTGNNDQTFIAHAMKYAAQNYNHAQKLCYGWNLYFIVIITVIFTT